MSVFLDGLACLFLLAGAVLLVVAAWGVITLPDALARQHAATKAGTLALVFISLGAACAMPEGEWAWRLGLIVFFLWITLPLASHLLARAAVHESAAQREAAARAPLRQTR